MAEFRKVLLLERNLSRDNPEGLAYRKKNLTQKFEGLKSLVDLGRALLLLEWGTDSGNTQVAEIDSDIRKKVADAFVARFKEIVKDGTTAEKAAAAYFLAESAVNLRKQGTSNDGTPSFGIAGAGNDASAARRDRRLKSRFVKIRYADLAPELVKLTIDADTSVRKAGAYALGLTQPDPATSVPALTALLQSPEVELRRAAATALNNSVSVVAEEQRRTLNLDVEPVEDPSDKNIMDARTRSAVQTVPVCCGASRPEQASRSSPPRSSRSAIRTSPCTAR